MINEYLAFQERRAIIYKEWNKALSSFIKDKEPEPFQTCIVGSTKELREIRENIMKLQLDGRVMEIVQKIEALEDTHLRRNVELQREKIQQMEGNNTLVREIEEEIMDLIQELIYIDRT